MPRYLVVFDRNHEYILLLLYIYVYCIYINVYILFICHPFSHSVCLSMCLTTIICQFVVCCIWNNFWLIFLLRLFFPLMETCPPRVPLYLCLCVLKCGRKGDMGVRDIPRRLKWKSTKSNSHHIYYTLYIFMMMARYYRSTALSNDDRVSAVPALAPGYWLNLTIEWMSLNNRATLLICILLTFFHLYKIQGSVYMWEIVECIV